MSLDFGWFGKDAKTQRFCEYARMESNEIVERLELIDSCIFPVAVEMAEWLRDNRSDDDIRALGSSAYRLYCRALEEDGYVVT